MPILTATFNPEYAAVVLTVDGSAWPSAVDAITITRRVAGEADIPVRGVESVAVVGGYWVGSDPEAPLDSMVTYVVAGSHAGAPVTSATATVDTTGANPNVLWIKVPGQPNLVTTARLRSVGEVSSSTIGGTYQIAHGGSVSQVAQWSGVESESTTLELSTEHPAGTAALRAALAAGRVVLLQSIGSTDLDDGWYYVSGMSRENRAGVESYRLRGFTLAVTRVGIPAGTGQGIPGWTYSILAGSYASYDALAADFSSYFDLLQGP